MSTEKHTPTAFRQGTGYDATQIYSDHKPGFQTNVAQALTKEDAAFIVRACNSHEALVKALSQLLDRLDFHGDLDAIREEGPIEDARAALKLAKEA